MMTETEAREKVLAAILPGPVEELPLLQALGRYAARPVLATVPLPAFDNSMMDGYAVRAADTENPAAWLPVVGEQPAGPVRGLAVGPGQAVRIFTGAPLPAGADAVIMQEDVDREGDAIRCREPVVPGESIRRAGGDLCQGQVLLKAGERLTAGRLGLLAAQGLAQVAVHAAPVVGVLSTGDELKPAGQPLAPGEIYNSNGLMLQALLAEQGITQSRALHSADTLEATVAALENLLADCDAVLLSGGVSVGDHDQVKPALARLGIWPELWRVKVKPGKPFLFACHGGKRIFGLPGNPVSSFVTCRLFVKPALARWMGAADLEPVRLPARLMAPLANDGNRPHYMHGRLENGGFRPIGIQQSHALFALSQANALLRVEAGERLAEGASVQVLA